MNLTYEFLFFTVFSVQNSLFEIVSNFHYFLQYLGPKYLEMYFIDYLDVIYPYRIRFDWFILVIYIIYF